MTKVCIIRTDFMCNQMFTDKGFELAKTPEEADLICFTGGPDVHPDLYDHEMHDLTSYDSYRDLVERGVYDQYKGKTPMVGICRGGQILNVLNGGILYQHVNNHGTCKHDVQDNEGNTWEVTSDHHQMMVPNLDEAEPFLHCIGLATKRELWDEDTNSFHDKYSQTMPDIEGVWYEDTGCMCFQPHPEWVGPDHDCQKVFFKYLKMFTGF